MNDVKAPAAAFYDFKTNSQQYNWSRHRYHLNQLKACALMAWLLANVRWLGDRGFVMRATNWLPIWLLLEGVFLTVVPKDNFGGSKFDSETVADFFDRKRT